MLVGLGLCGLLVALAALRVQSLRGQARAEVTRVLAETFGLHASVRDARVDLASASLLAHGIVLDRGGRVVLNARELRVRSSLAALLRGRLELRSVRISSATLRLSAADIRRLSRLPQGERSPVESLAIVDSRLVVELSPLVSVELSHADLELSAVSGGMRMALRRADAVVTQQGERTAQASLSLQGALSSQRAPTRAEGRLALEHARIAGRMLPEHVELAWHTDGERLGLQGSLALGPEAGSLAFSAALPFESARPFELRVQPKSARLSALLAQLGLSPVEVEAVLDGSVELRGSVQPLVLSGPLQIDASALRLGGGSGPAGAQSPMLALARCRTAANARFDAAGLTLEALRASLGHGGLEGHARVGYDGALVGELSGAALDLADVGQLAGVAIAGRGRVELHAQGALRAPDLHVVLAVEDGALGGVELGKVAADFYTEEAGRALRFERAEIAGGERRLAADGLRLRFDAGLSSAQARVRVTRLPLLDLYRLLGAEGDPLLSRLQSSAAGSAELVYGRLAGVQKLDLTLALALEETTLDGYRFDRGRLQARVAIPDTRRGLGAGTLTLEQLALSAGDGKLDLSGEITRGALALRVSLDKLRFARVPWLRAHMPALLGRIDGKGSLSGDSSRTRADLELALEDLELGGRTLGRAKLHAVLVGRDGASAQAAGSVACSQGRAALASGALHAGNGESEASAWLICGEGLAGHLQVDLALGTGEEQRLRGRVKLDDFELAAFLPERAAGSRVHGKLSASLELSGGGLKSPDRISGRLAVDKLELGEGESALASTAPFELRLHEGALELSGAALRGPKQQLVLSAAGSLAAGPRLIVDGTVAASLFSRTSRPTADAFGEVALHLEWSPGAQPALRGHAEPRDVLVRVEQGAFVRKLHGKLILAGEHVQLEGVGAELGGGELELQGELALQGLRVSSYDVALKATKVALEPQPRLEITFDSDTRLSWPGGSAAPKLSGQVRLKRVLYGRHIQLPEALTALNREDRATLAAYDPARDRLLLDLEVEHVQPMRIRNNFLDAELSLSGPDRKLRVVGSDQRFGLIGKLTVGRGRVLFHGDEFVVTRGEIAFDDEHRVAPSFDVRAVAERKGRADASVVFRARGTREAFDIGVRCDAGAAGAAGEPPPFSCEYAHDKLRCDSFDELVQLWLCRSKATLSSAEATR
jgi:hypothetical protein